MMPNLSRKEYQKKRARKIRAQETRAKKRILAQKKQQQRQNMTDEKKTIYLARQKERVKQYMQNLDENSKKAYLEKNRKTMRKKRDAETIDEKDARNKKRRLQRQKKMKTKPDRILKRFLKLLKKIDWEKVLENATWDETANAWVLRSTKVVSNSNLLEFVQIQLDNTEELLYRDPYYNPEYQSQPFFHLWENAIINDHLIAIPAKYKKGEMELWRFNYVDYIVSENVIFYKKNNTFYHVDPTRKTSDANSPECVFQYVGHPKKRPLDQPSKKPFQVEHFKQLRQLPRTPSAALSPSF